MSLPDFFVAHKHEVLTLMGEHLWLVGVSMLLAVAIGVPLGILLSRRPALKSLILGTNNIMQTIPSLALFGLLLPVPWIGARADRLAILALTLYALLPVVRNTYAGIAGVECRHHDRQGLRRIVGQHGREQEIGQGVHGLCLMWVVSLSALTSPPASSQTACDADGPA